LYKLVGVLSGSLQEMKRTPQNCRPVIRVHLFLFCSDGS